MLIKIRYRFIEDKKYFTCYLTSEQYQNFKILPSILEYDIIKKNQKETIHNYAKEMQKALDLAVKDDTKPIRNLSKII